MADIDAPRIDPQIKELRIETVACGGSTGFAARNAMQSWLQTPRSQGMSLEFNGKVLETDKDGFLQDLSEWSPELAEYMAELDELELGEDHWAVINYIRAYYEDYRIAPAVRILVKAMGRRLGRDKGNSRYLYQLFPYGPAKQACRYAGLPKPTGCV